MTTTETTAEEAPTGQAIEADGALPRDDTGAAAAGAAAGDGCSPSDQPEESMPEISVILASSSPRRRELLEKAGVKFTVRVSDVDETLEPDLAANPPQAAQKLAERKAGAVVQELLAEDLDGMYLVIGADTMVALNGEIFGKPAGFSHAKGMLRKLSGNTHQVHTGVALWMVSAFKSEDVTVGFRSFVDTSEVTFHELTDPQIDDYLAKGESYDKAGAYAVQGEGRALVKQVDGYLDTVIGLPAERLAAEFPEILGLA